MCGELVTTFRDSVFVLLQVKHFTNNTDGGLRMRLVCTVVYRNVDPWRFV
jgi:hypothetical protein